MFGPGLESSTSLIVRKILEGHSDLFTVVSMFPGQFGGMWYEIFLDNSVFIVILFVRHFQSSHIIVMIIMSL